MARFLLPLIGALLLIHNTAIAEVGHGNSVPSLNSKSNATVLVEDGSITITFGPIDLPVHHQGDLAASLPQHIFEIPTDLFITGFKASVFSEDGTPLAKEYLHHMLLIDLKKESLACPGENYFLVGAGMEMSEARFPSGYGIKLNKGSKVMAIVAFYHEVPPTRNVMASLKIWTASAGNKLKTLEAYHVGVNVGCYTKLDQREEGETDEGIPLKGGLLVKTAKIKFAIDGCIKYAYPHGHDNLVLLTLEDSITRRTLLRTIPNVTSRGDLLGFPVSQIYSDGSGFSVKANDEYEMRMVYYRPLQQQRSAYGMGNYLIYLTPGPC
ncbi:hypothetical protein [Nitrospira sp. Nam74]